MEKQEAKKRQRSENWLEEDKHLLMELVRERVSAIENKNTDTNTNTKKKAAWEDLLFSFNTMCKGEKRTIGQLKSQWGIIKMAKKEELAAERKEVTATGGGPPIQKHEGGGDDITSWLPYEFVVEFNEFDSDQTNFKDEAQKACGDPEIVVIDGDENALDIQIAPTGNNIETESKVPSSSRGEGKISQKPQVKESKVTSASKIVGVEVKCSRELPELQMNSERKKGRNLDLEETHSSELHELEAEFKRRKLRNLDLEETLLRTQIDFYVNKKRTFQNQFS